MPRTVAPTVWAFDCAWVPDADAGRRLLALDASEPEVFDAMWRAAGATPEQPRPVLPPVHCRVAAIAVVERRAYPSGEVGLHLCSLPRDPGDAEADLLAAFFGALGRCRPQLVGFNAHGADVRLLAQRGLVLGLAAPGLCRRPERPWEGPDYFHPHDDWSVDLMQAVGGRGAACPSLRDLALLAGIPAKTSGGGSCSGGDPGPSPGQAVADLWLAGEHETIRHYTECDALTIYLLWLRTARFAGLFSASELAEEEGRVETLLEREADRGAHHLRTFLERWRVLDA